MKPRHRAGNTSTAHQTPPPHALQHAHPCRFLRARAVSCAPTGLPARLPDLPAHENLTSHTKTRLRACNTSTAHQTPPPHALQHAHLCPHRRASAVSCALSLVPAHSAAQCRHRARLGSHGSMGRSTNASVRNTRLTRDCENAAVFASSQGTRLGCHLLSATILASPHGTLKPSGGLLPAQSFLHVPAHGVAGPGSCFPKST